ncbi:hypothetical protein BH10ACT11_BH10ACT11_10960 [soil metagenome]
MALSEAAGLLGKRAVPALPPWGTRTLVAPLRRLGIRFPDEILGLMRFGRGLDNRRFKATGFNYGFTSRETVQRLGEHLRLHPVMRGIEREYTYEREVEEFLRWSPHVQRAADADQEGVAADHEILGI